MLAKASQDPQLPHCSVSKGCMIKDPFHFLDGNGILDVFVSARLHHH
jgi:hypothetical protein